MNRSQLLARIDRPWHAFTASYAGLLDDAMHEPGVVGDWSVKDLIAHISIWEDESLKALPLLLEGLRSPRYNGIDRFNADQIAARRPLSLAAVLQASHDTHQRLMRYLESVHEAAYSTETRFRHRLRFDTYGHYPEHTEAVLAWRRARGL
jgi:hypothetical protein